MISRMQGQQKSALLFTVFCALAGLAPDAQAYLDPSTGSMILSAIVGLFATLGLAVKTYWYKLRNLLLRRPAETGRREDAAGTEAGRRGNADGTATDAATDSGPGNPDA
jgi:peptidoglycan/LPS O-acetylase OafA/YrhL